MHVYPQFVAYTLWTTQQYRCASCEKQINGHEAQIENVRNEQLLCQMCIDEPTPTGFDGADAPTVSE